jgi:hypothetical protein
VLVTTQTGAERLAPPGTPAPPSDRAGVGVGIGAALPGSRVVVV